MQESDSTAVMLGLKRIDRVFPFRLPGAPGLREYFLRTPFTSWVRQWEYALQQKLEQERTASLRRGWSSALPEPAEPAPGELRVVQSRTVPDTAAREAGILPGRLGEYAEIGMKVVGRGELGGAWTRYKPCDPGIQIACNPSLIPQLKPDMQFAVQVAGTISERVHVNVDYDQRREFDAANNINVFYQGFEDEVLQRVEVGDVSIRLPASRYLTQGIPAGNFGFKATGQLGPLEFQTVFAQQRGDVTTREFKLGGVGAGQKLEQQATLVLDDADYVEGQFFFLVDPDSIAGAPHIDALGLLASDAAASLRPARGGTIQVYRDERPALNNAQQQAQLGYFLADAIAETRRHSGLFRRLVESEHYVLHSSGLWIMLKSPLRADEALAISYVTESGDTIGSFDAERAPPGTTPVLKLLRGPVSIHQPGQPTWDYEMHQVYRLDSSNNVDVSTIQLKISLGDLTGGKTSRDVAGAPVSLLRLFGLDEDAPVDQLDQAQIYQPGRDAFGGMGGVGQASRQVTGTYIIFPTLRPFQGPAPVASSNLTAADLLNIFGRDLNPDIYEHPDPVAREGSGRFRLNFTYQLNVEGLSTFSLGAFGIREGSERIFLGERTLQPGLDYTIDYNLGTVTLNNAQALFALNPGADIRATWEQKSLFQIAPTSVFGLNARYLLGRRGELNFVGLYQSEKTIMARPQVGLEPGSIMLGGMSGRLDLGGYLLDRALARVPGLRLGAPSALSVTGEFALSVPNPNTSGDAYLDDFEATDELGLPTSRRRWVLGSRPETVQYAESVLPLPLDPRTATRLVWQHDVFQDGRIAGALLPRRQIDNQILIAGNELPEPVLWLTFGDSTPNTVGRRWRSMTTVLSTTGRDLTRSEYLEFYVWSSAARGQALVLDIGTVSEDAFFFDAEGRTNGFSTASGKNWGLGELDEEASAANREIWGRDKDELGLWDGACQANLLQQYRLGDPDANCARKNGEPDSEDLDGNGVFDSSDQAYFRYVIPIDEASPYLERDTSATGTTFRLFRVPLRTAGRPVNGASDATWRFIKHLRMTVASTPTTGPENFVLARMRIVGSRWTKRDVHGVVQGQIGDQPSPSAGAEQLEVGPVSRLNDANYAPPLGISDELQDASQSFGAGAIEFNEKALRLTYTALGPNDRAEVYFRYPQQSRGLLTYRQLRLWALARSGNWGPTGDQRFMVKAGNDPRNYYLFQSKLSAPVTTAAQPSDWLPELVIDFEQWFRLRERAEELLAESTPVPGQPLIVWSEDSAYAVVLEDRARAPNLAALRELSFAVYNGGSSISSGELWIDDMRLTSAFKEPGMAGTVSIDLRGGDFLSANVTYADQGSVFRQLNQEARYQRNGELSVSSIAQLGQFLPGGWGVDLPLTIVHSRSALDPMFLEGSDVRASRLDNVRQTGAAATRFGLALRKRTPSANPWLGLLVDGLQLRVGYNTADNSAITSRAEATGLDGSILYGRELSPRTFDILPGFMDRILRALAPAAVERSDFFERLSGSRLRWSPQRLSFGTNYYQQERRSYQFERILALGADSAVRPIESPRHGLQNDAQITLLPFSALRASFSLRSSRDLLVSERASSRPSERSAIDRARSELSGVDIGWETNRQISTDLSYRPEIAPWLRPNISYSARYGTDRNPSYLELQPDSSGIMQRRYQADRQLTRGLNLDPGGLAGAWFGLAAQVPDSVLAARGWLTRSSFRAARALQPLELNWNASLGSHFERELRRPGWRYQLGIGDFDAYRLIGGDTAVFVNARDAFSARSGVRLPFNTMLNAAYEETTLDAIDQRGGQRAERERRWPNLQFAWNRIPLPGFVTVVIKTANLTASHEQARRRSLLGNVGVQSRGGSEVRNALNLVLGLGPMFSSSYTGTFVDGSSTDPTGDAEHGSIRHVVGLTGTFHPPESMRETLKAPIMVNLSFTQQAERHCRFRQTVTGGTTGDACVSFIDFRNRGLNLVAETILSDLTLGLNLSYTARKSFVGTRNGTSQFQLGFFGNFSMSAGRELGALGR